MFMKSGSITVSFAITAMVAVVSSLPGQSCPSPCPDQGRTRISDAGKSNVTTVNCAQFTISVLGQSLATPPSCPDSYVFRDASEFGCGGVLVGHCCMPRDHKVTLKIFGPTNTCPVFPSPMPTSLEAASKAVQCSTPKLAKQTFNWSAGVRGCRGGAPNLSAGEPEHGEIVGGEYGYTYWKGAPDSLLGAADATLLQPWYASLETLDPVQLPSPLREIHMMCPRLSMVSVVAHVEIEYPQTGESYEYDVSGHAAGDGRFALTETGTYEHPEGDVRIAMDLSYDFSGFFVGQQGRPTYVAHAASRPEIRQTMSALGASVMPIVDWVCGPCMIALLDEVNRATDVVVVTSGGQQVEVVRVTETMPGSGWNGSRVMDVRDVQGRFEPMTITELGASGEVVSIKRLSDYVEFEPGGTHYRPSSVVVEDYEPGSNQPYRVVRLRVGQALPVAADDVPTWRRGSSLGWWYVFR